MLVENAEVATPRTTAAERLWTARVVHTALEEGLAKIDMAVATYGRREPLSLFCYGEPGTGKTTLAELFIERYRGAHLPGRILYVLLPCPASPSTVLEELLDKLGDPFPGRGTVANRMRRCRALFVRERIHRFSCNGVGAEAVNGRRNGNRGATQAVPCLHCLGQPVPGPGKDQSLRN